jgi:hydroxyacylglutathione hydrolase
MNATIIIQRYFVPGLAHASYLVADDGEAAVVDPKRDVDDYIADAERLGLQIKAVLETHPHADFVSGHAELTRRTGALIYVSRRAAARYPHRAVADGDLIRLGSLEIAALETPGHSPDSISWLVRKNAQIEAVFTGDTLFVGGVGRPDLRAAEITPLEQAGALYHSLFHRLLMLPDATRVYPAHGEGSLCGHSLAAAPFSTIGQERLGNSALQTADRADFIRRVTEALPDRPPYFSHVVAVNLQGAPTLGDLPPLRQVSQEAAQTAAGNGATLLDIRPPALFGAGHLPGSLNIGIESSLFSTWTGFFAPFGQPVALVAATATEAAAARLELARIGYDEVVGWVDGAALRGTESMKQLDVCELHKRLHSGQPPLVLDVRTASEWQAGHIAEARHAPLPTAQGAVEDLPRETELAVICGSGYRSSLATSLLRRKGFTRLRNVAGGMTAFVNSQRQ